MAQLTTQQYCNFYNMVDFDTFSEVLFPGEENDNYLDQKWTYFRSDPLNFYSVYKMAEVCVRGKWVDIDRAILDHMGL